MSRPSTLLALFLTFLTLLVATSSALPIPIIHVKKDGDVAFAAPAKRTAVSRTASAPRALQSGTTAPGTPQAGLVAAYSGSAPARKRADNFIGYLNGNEGAIGTYDNMYKKCQSDGNGGVICTTVPFTFAVPDSATELIDIGYDGFDDNSGNLIVLVQGPYYIGYNETSMSEEIYDYTIGPGYTNYGSLNSYSNYGVDNTPAGAPAVYEYSGPNTPAGFIESTIFNIDPSTGVLGVNWVNPNGQFIDVLTVWSPSDPTSTVYVTYDIDVLATTLGFDDLEPITLVFNTGLSDFEGST